MAFRRVDKNGRPFMDQPDGDYSFLPSSPSLPRFNSFAPRQAYRSEGLLSRCRRCMEGIVDIILFIPKWICTGMCVLIHYCTFGLLFNSGYANKAITRVRLYPFARAVEEIKDHVVEPFFFMKRRLPFAHFPLPSIDSVLALCLPLLTVAAFWWHSPLLRMLHRGPGINLIIGFGVVHIFLTMLILVDEFFLRGLRTCYGE